MFMFVQWCLAKKYLIIWIPVCQLFLLLSSNMASSDILHRFTDDDIGKALAYASEKLGFPEGFRTEQSTALKSFLRGHDLFISLPTGFGKSVIFQAAPLCMDFLRNLHQLQDTSRPKKAVALIVMPLKSLISDQMSRAGELKINAEDLTGGITDSIREGLSSSKYSMLFASPEGLLGEDGHEFFSIPAFKEQLCGLFIDESHCVSKWGCSSTDTKVFREAYGKLGEVRARFHSSIPAVALTATATKELRRSVADNLGLRNFVLIDRSPERHNTKHVVFKSKSKDLDRLFKWMADDLTTHGAATERTIIYCSSRKVVSDLYSTFLYHLPKSHYKHVNMFLTNTQKDIQQMIVDNFGVAEGHIRVLIATIAYGMGVDCKGLHRSIIFGRTVNLEDYMQMSGRIGRDKEPSIAISLLYPGDSVGRSTAKSMTEFFQGTRCRREVIRDVFGTPHGPSTCSQLDPHDCCDICASGCKCRGATCGANATSLEKGLQRVLESKESSEELMLNIPSSTEVDRLERALQGYKASLVMGDYFYCGEDLVSGFSDAMVKKIMKDCNVEFSFSRFIARYDFPSHKMASDVWSILCPTLGRDPTSLSDEFNTVDTDADTDSADVDMWSDSEFQEAVIVSDIEDD